MAPCSDTAVTRRLNDVMRIDPDHVWNRTGHELQSPRTMAAVPLASDRFLIAYSGVWKSENAAVIVPAIAYAGTAAAQQAGLGTSATVYVGGGRRPRAYGLQVTLDLHTRDTFLGEYAPLIPADSLRAAFQARLDAALKGDERRLLPVRVAGAATTHAQRRASLAWLKDVLPTLDDEVLEHTAHRLHYALLDAAVGRPEGVPETADGRRAHILRAAMAHAACQLATLPEEIDRLRDLILDGAPLHTLEDTAMGNAAQNGNTAAVRLLAAVDAPFAVPRWDSQIGPHPESVLERAVLRATNRHRPDRDAATIAAIIAAMGLDPSGKAWAVTSMHEVAAEAREIARLRADLLPEIERRVAARAVAAVAPARLGVAASDAG